MKLIYGIILDTDAIYHALGDKTLNLNKGDHCIINKNGILDYGQIKYILGKDKKEQSGNKEYPLIERKATFKDSGKANENMIRAKSAYKIALEHIKRLKLEMKLLNAHYSFDNKLVTFQFTANGRVDFRQLVKDLSKSLHTRIELRQIGVRDETAISGGLGICGYELCCKRFLKNFESINVKMVKEQELSLNPTAISGICGRLKCCLKYEHEGYLKLNEDMPKRGAICECSMGTGKIVDRNLLTQEVTINIYGENKNITCSKDEIDVIYDDENPEIEKE